MDLLELLLKWFDCTPVVPVYATFPWNIHTFVIWFVYVSVYLRKFCLREISHKQTLLEPGRLSA